MKKIVVFVLIMALCVPALFSCELINKITGSGGDIEVTPVQIVSAMYKVSEPTKVVATTKQDIGGLELNCNYELVTGYVDNRPASVYTVTSEEIRSVEDGGNNEEVKDIIKTTTKKTEAIEGTGTRVNGGDWDPSGTALIIGRGRMALNLKDEYVTNVKYENNTLTLTVPVANAAAVLGETYAKNISSDVKITIVNDGAVVTSIELNYFIKGDESVNLVESEMTVKVLYTYDLEKITIE